MHFARNVLIVSFLVIISAFVCADTYYVDVSAAGGAGDGSSWEDAYTTIGAAIDGADHGDEILVAEGIYLENIDLNGLAITLQSTEPNNPDVVAATIIDGGGAGTVVTCDSAETIDTVISGFCIQNGSGNSSNHAGGIYCYNSYPTIMHCVLIDNEVSGYGGGLFCYKGAPTLLSVKFFGNRATSGGGLSCYESDAIVENCVFSGNSGSTFGGGIYSYKSSPMVTGCSFSQNSSANGGGGYFSAGSPFVKNSILWDNGSELVISNGASLTVSYSNIEGGWGGNGSDNVAFAPGFMDPDGEDDIPGTADDDLSLDPFSLCINAGDPYGDYEGLTDMDGQARLLYGQVDIGADEVFPIGADLDENEQVDTDDLFEFAGGWVVDVNLSDFAFFAEQWLYGVESEVVE